MTKRGSSGLSLLLAIDKPKGMTSHDVVNRVRRVLGEKRVGHMGTLDPLASGVLCVAVGPATRLDAFMSGHNKTYVMDIAFGCATTTDDAEGEVISRGEAPSDLLNEQIAREVVASLVGKGKQLPPVYSAVKVNGQKSYAAARKGNVIDLKPRDFEVLSATLLSVEKKQLGELLPAVQEGSELVPVWRVSMEVSGGTYMRSIARDLGKRIGCGAFVSELKSASRSSTLKPSRVTLRALRSIRCACCRIVMRSCGILSSFVRSIMAHLSRRRSFRSTFRSPISLMMTFVVPLRSFLRLILVLRARRWLFLSIIILKRSIGSMNRRDSCVLNASFL